jgi:hypothetical protein
MRNKTPEYQSSLIKATGGKRISLKGVIARFLWLLMIFGLVAGHHLATTSPYFTDVETTLANTVQAWNASLWTQTTQQEFEAGVITQVDTSTSSGDVRLAVGSDWYQASWNRRKPVIINNASADLSDYQVSVDIIYDDDMRPDFDDIRFTDTDGLTLLPCWRESYIISSMATFWVKVPAVPSSTKTLYMYYGNPVAGSSSDGFTTFDFFDDFSGDLSQWNIHTGSNIGINAGYGNPAPCLEISGGNQSSFPFGLGIIGSDAVFASFQDGIIEADIYPETDGLPEIIFRGDYDANTGYKGRWDTRGDEEPPWFTPPYDGWSEFGDSVARFGIAQEWQKARLVITGDTFGIYNNDALMATVADSTYAGPGEIALANHYGNYARFDNVRVRQYASPEPTVSMGTEQGPYLSNGTIASQVLDTGITGANWNVLAWDATGDAVGWYNVNWSRRAPVVINNPGSALTGFQVKVNVTFDADMQVDFDDIRFTDSDGLTLLSHWRAMYTASSSARYWVKIPSLPSGTKTIYMYYGNGGVSSASNGPATFDFFDDFSGDLSQWTIDPENTDKVYIDAVNGNTAPSLRHDPDSSQTKNSYFDTRLMTTTYTMQNGVIEYDVYLAGTPRIIHQFGFRVNSLSFTNGYCWRIQNLTSDGGWLRFYNGSWSKIGTNWGPTTAGVWHTVKLEVVNDDFKAYIDGSGPISVTNTLKQTADHLVSHVHGVSLTSSSYVLVDNVRVRQYASLEPTASVGTEEISSGLSISVTFEVRASDTIFLKDAATPSWTAVGLNSPVMLILPSGRYMQWRAILTTSDEFNTPVLYEARIYYY